MVVQWCLHNIYIASHVKKLKGLNTDRHVMTYMYQRNIMVMSISVAQSGLYCNPLIPFKFLNFILLVAFSGIIIYWL